jgi:hypothetical protein
MAHYLIYKRQVSNLKVPFSSLILGFGSGYRIRVRLRVRIRVQPLINLLTPLSKPKFIHMKYQI